MNYLNDIENNKNYLGNEPVIRDLMDVGGIPSRLFDTSSYPLLTHMRVAYGRVNWDDFVVELDHGVLGIRSERASRYGSAFSVCHHNGQRYCRRSDSQRSRVPELLMIWKNSGPTS